MFDIGASELLLVVIVAIVVIGPKDLPLALRTAGRWIGKIRRVSGHFRTGIETMIREAELEEMEKKWREQNAAIIAESGQDATAAAIEPASDWVEAAPPIVEPAPVAALEEQDATRQAFAQPLADQPLADQPLADQPLAEPHNQPRLP